MALSLAQRRLSAQVRDLRRRTASVTGRIERADGTVEPITRDTMTDVNEAALRALAFASCSLAAALVIMGLS